jgi:plastocyanin
MSGGAATDLGTFVIRLCRGASMTPDANRPTGAGRRGRAAALLAAVALVLVACGGGSDAGLPDADIALLGTDTLLWEPDRLIVDAGTLSVAIVCERGANHNLVIVETGQEIAACAPGQTAFGEVTLDRGVYTYLCTVPGHEVTMRGVLEVR